MTEAPAGWHPDLDNGLPMEPHRGPLETAHDLLAALIGSGERLQDLYQAHTQLWRLEDSCREAGTTTETIGRLKHEIDDTNARRHRAIDAIDREVHAKNDQRVADAGGAEVRRSYQLTIGEFVDIMVVAQLKIDDLRRLMASESLRAELREECERFYALASRKAKHMDWIARALADDVSSGLAVLPPRADPKLYNTLEFRSAAG